VDEVWHGILTIPGLTDCVDESASELSSLDFAAHTLDKAKLHSNTFVDWGG
jgi:hypothetical protein